MMILTLPLADTDTNIDYTTVDEIKFSKKINGCERASAIMEAFSGHYHKKFSNGRISNSYREFYIEVEPRLFVSVRGYKHIVVCIVDEHYANFGPNGRARAERSNSLFEETKHVFPFRDVLERVRTISKARESERLTRELLDQEREFKFLSLEGFLVTEFGIPCQDLSRRTYDMQRITIDIALSPTQKWYKSSFSENEDGTIDVNICGYLPLNGLTKETAVAILNPMLTYIFDKNRFESEFLEQK